jgi:hypothetical protein
VSSKKKFNDKLCILNAPIQTIDIQMLVYIDNGHKKTPTASPIKLFYGRNCCCNLISQSVCHHISLLCYLNVCMQKVMTSLSGVPIRVQFKGRLLALSANIRPGWKGHNNWKHSSLLRPSKNYNRKKFCSTGLRGRYLKTFYGRNCGCNVIR